VQITFENGARQYKLGDEILDAARVVQIDRNPRPGQLHGTSALLAYSQNAWGLLAAGNQSMNVNQGGIPTAVLKSSRKLTADQAEALQTQWMTATQRRNGAPPVLPPELDFSVLSIDPASLSLLETQEWNSRVLATAYGVPAVILNMALQGGLTYQNPLALMQMWWLTELRTTAKRIGDAFSAQMLPRGQWISFDASDITSESINASDDEQASLSAGASPAQQPRPLTAIGGGGG
jgi:phage portal protein BeeE